MPIAIAHSAAVRALDGPRQDLGAVRRPTPSTSPAPTCTPSSVRRASACWFVVSWRSRVTPRRVGSTIGHDHLAVGRARGHEDAVGERPGGHAVLHAVEHPAVAVGRGRGRRVQRVGAGLGERRGRGSSRRSRRRAAARRAARRCRTRAIGSAPITRRVVRDRRDRATDLLEHERGLEEAVPAAALRLGERDAEHARRRRASPTARGRSSRRRPRPPSGARARARPRGSAWRGPAGPAAPREKEKSTCSRLLLLTEGRSGMPRPNTAIRSRCTSFTPPPNVRMMQAAVAVLQTRPAAPRRARRPSGTTFWPRISIRSRNASR